MFRLFKRYLIPALLQQVRANRLLWKSTMLFQILVCLAKHPYSEGELEVRIRDRTSPVEDPFDGFLCP